MAVGAWASEWKAVKTDFKEATGKSKPDSAKKIIGFIGVHTSNVSDALQEVDSCYATYSQGVNAVEAEKDVKKQQKLIATTTDALNKFGRAVAAMQKSKAAYLPAITKGIDEETKKMANGDGAKTLYYKSCKVLEKSLDAIDKTVVSQQSFLFHNFQAIKQKIENGGGGESALKTAAKANLVPSLISATAKGRTFVAALKVAAEKDMAKCILVFNAGSKNAVRDVTQPLLNLKKEGLTPPHAAEGWLVQHNGGSYILDKAMTKPDFLAELKVLDTHYKGVADWAATLR